MTFDRKRMAMALIFAVPALLAMTIGLREFLMNRQANFRVLAELSEIDTPTQRIARQYPPSPCDLAVYTLRTRCEGQIKNNSFDESLSQCSASEQPWDCVLSCLEKDMDCEELPACIVRCTEAGRAGGIADAAQEDSPYYPKMALILGGWSVLRLKGPRWQRQNQKFKLVHMDAFAMDRYEYPNKKGSLPVAGSWQIAKESCEMEGERLCAWAEWQKVCGQAVGMNYPFGDNFECGKCSFVSCTQPDNILGPGEIRPSGSFPACAGRYGVYDMAGNVSEFVDDLWGPWDDDRMVAGGSYNENWMNNQKLLESGKWEFDTYSSQCSAVHHHEPNIRHEDDGFRCCRDVEKSLSPLDRF